MKSDINLKVIKNARVTEKAASLSSTQNQYVFDVHPDASRFMVKSAIEKTFDVHPVSVNVLNREGKVKRSRTRRGAANGRTAQKKIAIVTLKAGEKIEII